MKREGKEKTPKIKKRSTTPKDKRQIPFSRRKATKTASILFFSVIFLSLLFNVIFFSKYDSIRDSVKAQENSIQDQLKQVKNSDSLNSHSVVVFTGEFLQNYINIPKEENRRKDRIEELTTYFVNGYDIKRLGEIEEFKGSRKLKELEYVQTERVSKNEAKIHFYVTYDITEITVREEKVKTTQEVKEKGKKVKKPVEKIVKKETPKTISNSVEIVVPVTTDGEGYAVYQNPNLIERDLKSNIQAEDKELEGEQVTATEQRQIEQHLKEFFTSYGVSDEKLPYMAEVERGLQNQIFKSLIIRQAVNEDGIFKVLVDVQYQNKETSLNGLYTYELELTSENNKYFIESIQ